MALYDWQGQVFTSVESSRVSLVNAEDTNEVSKIGLNLFSATNGMLKVGDFSF